MTTPSDLSPRLTTVLIDASSLSAVAARSGIGTYVRNLLPALAALAPDPDGGIAVNALVAPEVSLAPGIGRRPLQRFVKKRARAEVIEHAVRVPLEVRRWRGAGEVFHNPGFHAPWGVHSPWVQTLHDLIPLTTDDPHLDALKTRWRRFGPRYREADAIIAISRHAADEGIRLLDLDGRRIHIAHHGVNPIFTPAPAGAPAADPPYLLVVAEYSRRKGFAEAFAVVSALADAGYPHTLKVAGQVHDFVVDEVTELRARAGRPERIELLGFVPDLPSLYRQATAVIMTSRYEGFGLPVVEGMACGVPVVSFANSALTEVVAAGGWLVADGDVGAMVAALRTLLAQPDVWLEWRQRGLDRAAHFTWSGSAARHAAVYRAVAERRG
jgi:glycosyltransferase involved in cell wall biosynthesis